MSNQNLPEEERSPAADPAAEKKAREKAILAKPGNELYQNVRTLVTVLAVLILLFAFVLRILIVSGPSMENTLQNGEAMVVWSLGYKPRQGDIVVLTQPAFQEDSIVKRVIATGGQRVRIDYSAGTVTVDGQVLEEPYIKERMKVPSYGLGNYDLTVPDGCIFVMGDNRNESADSRYPIIGVIDERSVIGKALLVAFPFSEFRLLKGGDAQ